MIPNAGLALTEAQESNMNKAHKQLLKENYEKACNAYLEALLQMWGLSPRYGYWNSDKVGTIYHYGDSHNLSMDEIIYCVENDITEHEVMEWEDYILDAYEFGMSIINLQAWQKGCPRVSKEEFEVLRQKKKELENLCEEYKNNKTTTLY